MIQKYKVWRSTDGKWTVLLVNDGASQSTLSLTKDEAADLRRQLVIHARILPEHPRGTENQVMSLLGLKEGHVLTADDVKAIADITDDYNDALQEEANAFHDGRVAAYREIGGEELVLIANARDEAERDKLVARAMKMFREQTSKYDAEKAEIER